MADQIGMLEARITAIENKIAAQEAEAAEQLERLREHRQAVRDWEPDPISLPPLLTTLTD